MAALRSLAIRLGYYNAKDALSCYISDVVCDMTTEIYDSFGKIISAEKSTRLFEFDTFSGLIDKMLGYVEESM